MAYEGDNRSKILHCALKLFAAKGYDGIGIQEIVDSAGITKPTLYHYFGSKEGVFKTLMQNYYDQFNETLLQCAVYNPQPAKYEKDVYPVLLKIAQTYFLFAKKNELFYRLHLAAAVALPESEPYRITTQMSTVQFDLLKKLFDEIALTHGNVKRKTRACSSAFIGVLNSYITLYFNKSGQLNDQIAEEVVHQFMHGIFA